MSIRQAESESPAIGRPGGPDEGRLHALDVNRDARNGPARCIDGDALDLAVIRLAPQAKKRRQQQERETTRRPRRHSGSTIL